MMNPRNRVEEKPSEFDEYKVENKDKNITVHFFVLMKENEDGLVFDKFFFFTKETGPIIAYIDAGIDLLKNRKLIDLPNLRVKEIDSFLRDNNLVESFPEATHQLYLYHDFFTNLHKLLSDKYFGANKRFSPTLARDYFPRQGTVNSQKLQWDQLFGEEKIILLEQVIDQLIRPHLKRDLGDLELVHVEGNMIVFNYVGTCRDCQFSLSSTFEYIQQVLRRELLSPHLLIVTDN